MKKRLYFIDNGDKNQYYLRGDSYFKIFSAFSLLNA